MVVSSKAQKARQLHKEAADELVLQLLMSCQAVYTTQQAAA